MMNLVDTKVLADYIYAYNCGAGFNMQASRFLENWEKAKQERLFKLMGEQLILEKEIVIDKTQEALETEMAEISLSIKDLYYNFMHSKYDWDCDELADLRTLYFQVFNVEALVKNRINFEGKVKIGSKTLSFNRGQKTIRAIGNILKAIEFDRMDAFEYFKLEHSRVLNDKSLKGTFCLSIHPMDYITVSDNDCGWESCLSWKNDGCYRGGTLELVNCPRTIVAYLKSSKDMEIDYCSDSTWNSKRWRQLIIADEAAIISNKAYPYASDALTKIALDWVKELAEKNCGEKYLDELVDYDNDGLDNIIVVQTGLVYNDLDGNGANGKVYLGYNSTVYDPDKSKWAPHTPQIIMGGEARCLTCGKTFENENALHCCSCSGEEWCDYCEGYHSDDVTVTANGEHICQYCYEHYYAYCEICGEVHHHNDIYQDDDGMCLCEPCYNERKEETEE